MDSRKTDLRFILGLLFLGLAFNVFSQKMTSVRGTVMDADTKEPLMFVNLSFVGTNIGTDTDFDGKFLLESKFASDGISVSYVGYEPQTISIEKFTRQVLQIQLVPNAIELTTAVVKEKRKRRIKNSENPAVTIMNQVIEKKGGNRIEGQAFYEYEKYEKVEFDLNNFDPDKMMKRKAFQKFQFLFDFVDTSELNGKPYLPFFIQESSSKVYYRKDPESMKEYRSAIKVTGIEDYVDIKDFTTMLDVLYQKIDIYENNVRILDLTFMSPLNPVSPTFYNFYLTDSMAVMNSHPCYHISFYPRNKQDMAFKGDLFIQKGSYAVIKADLGIVKSVNLNFVQDLKLVQEFEQRDGVWVLEKDKVILDFSVFKQGTGVFGSRDVSRKDFAFGNKKEESIYEGSENVIAAEDAYKKDETYWQAARHDSLSTAQKGVYEMVDTLQKAPAFKTVMTIFTLAFTGYKAWGPVSVGPIGNFYSYNPVEGWRVKLGGETNLKFHPKLQFAGYGAYGTKDHEFKYGASLLYSFREDYQVNPKHFLRLSYQHDVNLVGQILPFSSADNFFLSFQRGNRDRMLFLEKYRAEYLLELPNNLSWNISYTNADQQAIGGTVLSYTPTGTDVPRTLPGLRTSEAEVVFRFAPNEKYLQGHTYRVPLYTRFPIFTLTLNAGMKDVLGGDYEYYSVKLNILKRFYMSLFGNMKLEIEGGKYFGEGVPYFLLNLPRANQSFAYRSGAYNMMNYQEFVNDVYVSLQVEHYFKGFFLNKVPLLRKLKLREVVAFKGIYGGLTDKNNPNLHADYIQFIKEDDGLPISYTLEEKPYMEASVGVMNIFKFGRIDLIRRLTYLDNPGVPTLFGVKGLGLRAKLALEF